MNAKQERPAPYALASKPSSAFSTSSFGSATSAATSRSGGNKLLFGEIDTNSDRSSESYASVCSFVQSNSSTFLRFWLEDKCRETFLSFIPRDDLANLRRVCHDFSVRGAPALFSDLSITFRSNTFTKPAKLAALDRMGFYVKTLHFEIPHSANSFLPPLVEPETGEELDFSYIPQLQENGSRNKPKYGDAAITEILTRQYPPIFHAATNVSAFVRAFSTFVNIKHLKVSCPGYDCTQKYRRSVVDYALLSVRIAVERNCLNSLDTLTLSPIHVDGLVHLNSHFGQGASPKSAKRWSQIRHLTIECVAGAPDDAAHSIKLIHSYLRNFQTQLESFHFRWMGAKGPLPIQEYVPSRLLAGERSPGSGPALYNNTQSPKHHISPRPLHFSRMKHVGVENVVACAAEISTFIAMHKRSLEELKFDDIDLKQGTWDDALAPLVKKARPRCPVEMDDIPIMLSPTMATSFPASMERVEAVRPPCGTQKSLPFSKWFSSAGSPSTTTKRVRDGFSGCEGQLRKVFRGSVFPWK